MNNISSVERFLLFSAALDPDIYVQCTTSEQRRLVTSGIFVLIPAFLACFSGIFAAPLVFDNSITVFVFPFLYAILIYIIDRAIVMHTKSGEINFPMFVRFMLALLLSLMMSEPLVLHVFRDEIKGTEERRSKAIESQYDSALGVAIKPLLIQIRSNDSIVLASLYAFSTETDGSGGTQTSGIGAVAREKKTIWEDLKKSMDKKNKQIINQIEQLKTISDNRKRTALQAIPKGIAGKMNTLHELADNSYLIWITSLILRIILIIFDMLPILFKLMPTSKRYELYSYLLRQKHECYFDAINAQSGRAFETVQNEVNLISEHQSLNSETRYVQEISEGFRNHIQALTDECYELYKSKKGVEHSIEAMIKDEKLKKAYLERIEDEFVVLINKISKAKGNSSQSKN